MQQHSRKIIQYLVLVRTYHMMRTYGTTLGRWGIGNFYLLVSYDKIHACIKNGTKFQTNGDTQGLFPGYFLPASTTCINSSFISVFCPATKASNTGGKTYSDRGQMALGIHSTTRLLSREVLVVGHKGLAGSQEAVVRVYQPARDHTRTEGRSSTSLQHAWWQVDYSYPRTAITWSGNIRHVLIFI